MTQKSAMNTHELAQVLSRINLLVDQQAQTAEPEDERIPVLTEIYSADSRLVAMPLPDVPVLQEMVQTVVADQQPLSAEMADRFLAEIRPLLLKTVKIAVLEESVKAEKILSAKLEQEILVLLRDRLVTKLA